jgi:hypothetical protein
MQEDTAGAPATELRPGSNDLHDAFAPPPVLRLAPPPLPFGDAADALDDDGEDEAADGAEADQQAGAAVAGIAEAVPAEADKAAATAGSARGIAPKLFEERFLPQLVRAVHGSSEGIEKLRARFR